MNGFPENEVPEETTPRSPYAILGVDQRARAEEVRRAYFRLVRQYPPETHPEEFKRIRAAYETLRSPMRRAELALESFDEHVNEIDLDLLEALAGPTEAGELDAAAVLLAVELSASDLFRSEFPEDLTPIAGTSLGIPAPSSESRPGADDAEAEARDSG